MALRITRQVFDRMRRHAERTYPCECCGVLLSAEDGTVVKAEPCLNAHPDSPQTRYNIDPKDLIRIQLDSREEGLRIAGFYHSHPDHPAHYSPTDLAEAHWYGCSYVITGVAKGVAEETKSFLLSGNEAAKQFDEQQIEVLEDAS